MWLESSLKFNLESLRYILLGDLFVLCRRERVVNLIGVEDLFHLLVDHGVSVLLGLINFLDLGLVLPCTEDVVSLTEPVRVYVRSAAKLSFVFNFLDLHLPFGA